MSLRIAGGAVFFNPLVNGVLQGQIKFGSTQAFTAAASTNKIQSYNNDDTGIGLKEADVAVRKEYSATTLVRQVSLEMLALAFGADAVSTRNQAAGPLAETLAAVKQGRYYQLGQGVGFESGARNISNETVEVATVAKTGYTLDGPLARLYIVPGGDINDGDDVDVTGDLAAATWDAVLSGDAEAVGEMQIIGKAATGTTIDYFMPSVSLSLDGDYALKSDPENAGFQQLPLRIEILEDTAGGRAALYIDGRPA